MHFFLPNSSTHSIVMYVGREQPTLTVQVPSAQKAFAKDITALISVIEEIRNPFCEDRTDYLVLDTKEILPNCVEEAVSTTKVKEQSMYRPLS